MQKSWFLVSSSLSHCLLCHATWHSRRASTDFAVLFFRSPQTWNDNVTVRGIGDQSATPPHDPNTFISSCLLFAFTVRFNSFFPPIFFFSKEGSKSLFMAHSLLTPPLKITKQHINTSHIFIQRNFRAFSTAEGQRLKAETKKKERAKESERARERGMQKRQRLATELSQTSGI